MTELLEKVISRIEQLSDDEQDEFASWILAELSSEKKWKSSFEDSADELSSLADEALEEHDAGKTEKLDPEDL